MKKRVISFVIAVLLVFSLFPLPSLAEDADSDGYNDHDIVQIKAFLIQDSANAGTSNCDQLGYSINDPGTWSDVSWIEITGEKCVQNISWDNRSLAGSLDLSGCTALQGLTCSDNVLSSLNISGVTTLSSFDCSDNRLKEISAEISGGSVKLSTEGSGYVGIYLDSETFTAAATEAPVSQFLNWTDTKGNVLTTDKTYALSTGENYDLKANYTATVTFDSRGGSAVPPQTATEGTYIPSPAIPTRADYTFAGWYAGINDPAAISFPYRLIGNTALYAKWQYNCAYLKGIDITPGAKITPAFIRTKYYYTVLLDEYTESVTITPYKENDSAILTVGETQQSSIDVSLANGKYQKINIKVVFGSTSRTYTITVKRANSTNNYLDSLVSSGAPLSPAFNKNKALYTVELPESVNSTTITALAELPDLTRVYYTDKTYTLDPGQYKRAVIKVRSQAGAYRYYYITIHRSSSAEAEIQQRGNYILSNSAIYKQVILNPGAYSNWAAAINRLQAELPDKRIIVMSPPSSFALYAPDEYRNAGNDQKSGIQDMYSQLSSNVYSVDAYSYLEENKDEYIYFRTDHHWTARGAYYGYTAFCEKLGMTPVSLEDMQQHYLFRDFLGSYYKGNTATSKGRLIHNIPDVIEFFTPLSFGNTYGQETVFSNTSLLRGRSYLMFWMNRPDSSNYYRLFLGGDHPCIKLTTDTKNGRSILIVKDSYANAFVPYLVSHYENIYLVDFRDYNSGRKPAFQVTKFVNDNNIDDVLLLLSFDLASSSGYINWYNKALPY